MAQTKLLNTKGEEVGQLDLNKDIFNGKISAVTVYEAVLQELASRRSGTADTKTRSEVRGGGRKPWRQKGSGQARAGSVRSPIWKGGGVVFGPHPRSFAYTLPKKMRRVALRSVLNAKLKEEAIRVIDELEMEKARTKDAVEILKNLNVSGRVVVVADNPSEEIKLSFRNLAGVTLKRWDNLSVHELLDADGVVFTKKAFEKAEQILKKTGKG